MTTQVIQAKRGPMIVESRDEYVGRSFIELGEFGEEQIALFERIVTPEMVVVDAGANIGALTVALARLAKHVHAFEPQRHAYHMLCGNVALHNLRNVACYHAALGARDEIMDIAMLDTDVENNLGAFSLETAGAKLDRVRVIPLNIPCQFLKIDVEGYEAQVLEGAAPMIAQCNPVIYVENDRREKSDALITQIRAMGYTPYWHVTPMYRPDNFRGATNDIWPNLCSFDMLCVRGQGSVDGNEAHVGDFDRMNVEVAHAA